MAKVDKTLKQQDSERKHAVGEVFDHLESKGLPPWKGFESSDKVIAVRGGSGQVHVGDVFRGVFPTLNYLRSKNMRVVLASSPNLDKMFDKWRDTLTVINGNAPIEEQTELFKQEGVESFVKWTDLLRKWRKELSGVFDEASHPVMRSPIIDVPANLALSLRQKYSDHGNKKVLGIIWRTSMIGRDPHRNADLAAFEEPIHHNPDKWNVVSLQYGSLDITRQEIDRFNAKKGRGRVIFDPDIDPMKDYIAASAQMAACDHIISIDCSQIFQAGASGVPVSTLLSADPAKQWENFSPHLTDICPFFPDTNRIYMQTKLDDWSPVIGLAHERAISETKHRGPWNHPAAEKIKLALAAG